MVISRAGEISRSNVQILCLAIYAVTINGERNVEFSYDDPNMQMLAEDDPRWDEISSKMDSMRIPDRFPLSRRDLATFLKRQQRFSEYVDPDESNGELTIFIPPSLQEPKRNASTAATTNDEQNLTDIVYKVTIDFALEQPENGIHFFVPDDDAKLSRVSAVKGLKSTLKRELF